jgi:Ni/Co efflux regulator RcnB
MKIQISTAFLSIVTALGLSSAGVAPASAQPAVQSVQYDRYPDQRRGGDYPPPPPYAGERRDDGYYPYPPRDAYDRDYPLWRAGDVVPGELLDFVVDDWEPRGLERPPGGHQWVRTRGQFLLVRERDRMIARVITFD